MLHGEALGLLFGAVALGAVHGIEPGHGWPVAASYALDQRYKWVHGFAASLLLGIGHLVSSIAMVVAFFYAKSYFELTQLDDPIALFGGLEIGGPVSLVAGALLIALGIREYRHGHSHGIGTDDGGHNHDHGDDGHSHGHDDGGHNHDYGHGHDHGHNHGGRGYTHAHGQRHDHDSLFERLKRRLPFVGGHSHAHDADSADERGLLGIAWFAFLLGFAHEEEFEIIALCSGSAHCLELMTAYALTVIVGIVTLTMLLIAGYESFEEDVERLAPYLPVFSAVVLVGMGLGFVLGVL
jgi:ABC-type nickel/cobalt efflux system permease component RcnA